jgi:hypothetical protein
MDLEILTDLHVFRAPEQEEVGFGMRSLSLSMCVRACAMQRSIGLLASVLNDGSDFILCSAFKYLSIIGCCTVSMNIVALTLQIGHKIKMKYKIAIKFL